MGRVRRIEGGKETYGVGIGPRRHWNGRVDAWTGGSGTGGYRIGDVDLLGFESIVEPSSLTSPPTAFTRREWQNLNRPFFRVRAL